MPSLEHVSRGERTGEKGGEPAGPNPVDRCEPGSEPPLLSDANALPLVVGFAAANTHDSAMFVPLLDGIAAIRSRRGPRRRRPDKLHADKGYDADDLRAYCAGSASPHASPAAASSPANGSAAGAGRSSGRSPGSSAAGG